MLAIALQRERKLCMFFPPVSAQMGHLQAGFFASANRHLQLRHARIERRYHCKLASPVIDIGAPALDKGIRILTPLRAPARRVERTVNLALPSR